MRHLRNQIQRLIRDTAGNILPLAAVGMVVAAMVVGSGIDFSRYYKARNQLQAACDAGVLAGRRTVSNSGLDAPSIQAAQDYFATNFDDNGQETTGTAFTPSTTDNGQTVRGVASTTLNTLVMRLFGFNTFNISVSCASSMSVGNADVMMVLDTTGSMDSALSGSQTRIQALRAAMKNFYSTLYSATSGTTARVRYGFVPYSSTVNVGRLLYALNPSYLADSHTYQSRQWSTSKSTFYYQPVSYDTSVFKTFARTQTPTGSNGSTQSSTWDGCIEERATTTASSFSYSPTTGYSPAGARDIDIDSAPTTDINTKWSPQWYQISYIRGKNASSDTSNWTTSTTTQGSSVSEYCPVKAQLLTEMSQTDFNAYADSLVANGGTYLDIGMIWGGRLISPDGIFSGNVNIAPSNKGEVARHIIFMTDGQMDTANSSTSAWGIDWWDLRVTQNGSETTADAVHTSRFRAVCDAIKAKGVRIWAIAFTSTLSKDLTYCASENSSYTASDSDELNTAFLEIAKQIGELRITQ
ncbi:pilus assembly protein TadG-related protein [Novosphingobium sp. BL-8H]|uniref:pilus assembly protein TadG-related protein n=1 Tax=Novosphingobium sp. BL-8H TaxID=3127640 RepID=UPI003756B78F